MSDPQNEPIYANEAPARSVNWLPAWELIALFIGDLITLLLFGMWGEAGHGLLQTNTSPFRAVVNIAAPFMVAWLVVGAVVGTYRATALYPLTRVIWKTALAGLIAGPLGGVLWALARGRWPSDPIFYVVTTSISTTMLIVWRVLWSRLRRSWWTELP